MKRELPKAYEPHEVERRWSEVWLKEGYFHAEPKSSKPPFCMVIPPPNVTGSLHMGHALNNTLQDILARYKRMKGFNVLWMPGTDHAGIATQNVVERDIAKEGKKRQDLGRERFIEKVWEWKRQSGGQIIHQLKRLGASCDWKRERFTMDEGLSRAVREAFVRLYNKGLIYRDLYLINWCPRCKTALSDLEVEHHETNGHLWFVRYPFASPLPSAGEGVGVRVATTRPETMLGDTAVAVHPEDERYKGLIGKKLLLPLVNREIPIISDPRVDKEFGTGAVKVTPAHDFNDFIFGNDHKLPRINIFTDEGRMNENAVSFQGLDRFECRKKIVEELEQQGFLEKVEPHKLSVGHCYRCRTVVEPYLSMQWFVKTKPLAEKALQAVQDGKARFFPDNWTKTYANWMGEIKDWCVSRQIWWGHRIPAWYCIPSLKLRGGKGGICPPIVSRDIPKKCPTCGSTELEQDSDVLDTWFSSALWPFSTLGWPDQTEELKTFYPTSVLITGFDIIFFWVARMMMMGLEFMREVPFKDIYIHALVRDAQGQKMSKSKGNVIDPLTIMDQFGTDAFRFTLAVLAVPGRDVKLSEPVIEGYRNFCNKIWNAARFFVSLPPQEISREVLSDYDQWILQKWAFSLAKITREIEGYRFDEAAKELYDFFWHTLCDWYLEFSKVRLNQSVFSEILDETLRVLHPFMPFITEEICQFLNQKEGLSIGIESFPTPKQWDFEGEPRRVERLMEIVTALRTLRGENGIQAAQEIQPILSVEEREERHWLEGEKGMIEKMTRSCSLQFVSAKPVSKKMAHYSLGRLDLYLPLEGLVDLETEKKRLEKEIQKLNELGDRLHKKLSDPGFLNHADPELVAEERQKQRTNVEKIERLSETYRNL
ncbi:MAG: valine--tRNA ligase [Deltaproteobacteria bacterium]|nr:valine--tRNA ligase [Deltaproteobacteria bacterium]